MTGAPDKRRKGTRRARYRTSESRRRRIGKMPGSSAHRAEISCQAATALSSSTLAWLRWVSTSYTRFCAATVRSTTSLATATAFSASCLDVGQHGLGLGQLLGGEAALASATPARHSRTAPWRPPGRHSAARSAPPARRPDWPSGRRTGRRDRTWGSFSSGSLSSVARTRRRPWPWEAPFCCTAQ